nr:basic salivary proline-rich protein 2-like [Globicephala melas]
MHLNDRFRRSTAPEATPPPPPSKPQEPSSALLEAGSPAGPCALPTASGAARAARSSLPRGQVGAGSGHPGCGGRRGLGREVGACGCGGPRPEDLPRLGLRRGRAPLPSPPGRCPMKSAQRSDGICPRSPTQQVSANDGCWRTVMLVLTLVYEDQKPRSPQ